MKSLLAVAAVVIVIVLLVLRRRSTAGPRIGEIAPSAVLQKKYGLYAENRPIIHIDPAAVPGRFRSLIPMAEKWGIGDDIIRCDFEDKASPRERQELEEALNEKEEEVATWVRSFDPSAIPEDVVPFMFMLIAMDEMRPVRD